MKDWISLLHLGRTWVGILVVWVVGVVSFAWLNAGMNWQQIVPKNDLNWFITAGVLLGPPFLILFIGNVAVTLYRRSPQFLSKFVMFFRRVKKLNDVYRNLD
ncbi:MAG: hypothetical protein HQ503_14090 [Rhodospirillales bacterium]|nr:hypothetical protein [Rhodospirillales bacterium]